MILVCDACSRGVILWVLCVFLVYSCVLVSVVHPVAIFSAVFGVICSSLMLVCDASGDHVLKHARIWFLLWLYMLRVSFPFVFLWVST